MRPYLHMAKGMRKLRICLRHQAKSLIDSVGSPVPQGHCFCDYVLCPGGSQGSIPLLPVGLNVSLLNC